MCFPSIFRPFGNGQATVAFNVQLAKTEISVVGAFWLQPFAGCLGHLIFQQKNLGDLAARRS